MGRRLLFNGDSTSIGEDEQVLKGMFGGDGGGDYGGDGGENGQWGWGGGRDGGGGGCTR